MRIAVTGGSGRLGGYVQQALQGHSLRVIDITAPNNQALEFQSADLRDLDGLVTALQGIEVVVHLGGIDRSVARSDAETMAVNALGTWNLFEASRRVGVRRVVHASSSSVTGLDASNPGMPPRYLPVDEAHEIRPSDAYGISKVCSEAIARGFASRGMEVLILRPCLVAFPDLMGFMAGHPSPAGREEPAPLLRAYVGAEDCARAFAAAATVAHEGCKTLFVAADDSFSDKPTLTRLEALYRVSITVRDPEYFQRRPNASPVTNTAAKARLGWSPTTQWTGSTLIEVR